MSVEALVLPELSVVAADVLIGSDFVESCSGLHLEYSDDGSLVGVTFGRTAMKDIDAEVAANTVESALPGSVCDVEQKLSRHIAVEHDARTLSCQWMMVRYVGADVKDTGLHGEGGPTAMPLVGTSVLELLSTRAPGCLPSKTRSSPQLSMSG